MALHPPDAMRVLLLGFGATAAMDAWLWALRRLGAPTPDFGLVGRWVGHLARGRWAHAAIARAAPVAGERALGWAAHYVTGVVFAGLFAVLVGDAWLDRPTPRPALVFGVGTVLAPLLVMQPAMGAGIASSRTAAPLKNVLRSVANHAAFGLGLYLAAVALSALGR